MNTRPQLRPKADEIAAISLLGVQAGDERLVVAGSLLALPAEAASLSWRGWLDLQPVTRGHGNGAQEPGIGPEFDEEPFPGVLIHRSLHLASKWDELVAQADSGALTLSGDTYLLRGGDWSSLRIYGQHGESEAHAVLWSACRPVRGISIETEAVEIPPTEGIWAKGSTSTKPLGKRSREELVGAEIFANWPIKILGIHWPGAPELSPPHRFVIGRAEGGAWIRDVIPDHENDLLRIAIAWEAERVDPLSCSLLARAELEGIPLLSRVIRISDNPGEGERSNPAGTEVHEMAWNQRTLDVYLPHGVRGAEWGVQLLGPDGALLDERPVVRRVERIEFSIHLGDSGEPAHTSVLGDQRAAANEGDRDVAIAAARDLDAETAARAAKRRLSTAGELESYLRWRFSCRAGELLVADPYLLSGTPEVVERVLAFLAGLRRPVRALSAKNSAGASAIPLPSPDLEVRLLSSGSADLHDRIWLVGDTGVLTGSSLNDFLQQDNENQGAATTAVDLPHADAAGWREAFERWWASARTLPKSGART